MLKPFSQKSVLLPDFHPAIQASGTATTGSGSSLQLRSIFNRPWSEHRSPKCPERGVNHATLLPFRRRWPLPPVFRPRKCSGCPAPSPLLRHRHPAGTSDTHGFGWPPSPFPFSLSALLNWACGCPDAISPPDSGYPHRNRAWSCPIRSLPAGSSDDPWPECPGRQPSNLSRPPPLSACWSLGNPPPWGIRSRRSGSRASYWRCSKRASRTAASRSSTPR